MTGSGAKTVRVIVTTVIAVLLLLLGLSLYRMCLVVQVVEPH